MLILTRLQQMIMLSEERYSNEDYYNEIYRIDTAT